MLPQAGVRLTPVAALLLGIGVLVLGNGLQGTLLGVRAGLEGFREETIGAVMSAYFAGYVAGSLLCPGLVARYGHIRVFAALASIASAATLGHVLHIDPWSWAALRAGNGFCYAGLIMVAESWLNSHALLETRGRLLSVYGMVMMGAWAASQGLLNLAAPEGFALFALVSILLSLSLVPVAFTRSPAPRAIALERLSVRRLYAISPVGTTGSLLVGMSMSAYWGMGPTFAQGIGLDAARLSAFMAAPMFGSIVLQWPLGWLSDRVDRRAVIALAALLTAVAALALALGGDMALPLLLGVAVLFGGLGLPIYSICVANTNDYTEEGGLVAAASGLLLLYGVGAAIGPFLASVVMGLVGVPGLFYCIAALHTLLFAVAARQIGRRAARPAAEREAYVAMPGASHVGTHVALDLDPRTGSPAGQGEPPPGEAGREGAR